MSFDEEQITVVRQDLAEYMIVSAISQKYGIPRTTVRGNIERSGMRVK